MAETIIIRPHGQVEFREYEIGGETMVSILLPDGADDRVLDVEFRLADFVAFADYAAGAASELVNDAEPEERAGIFHRIFGRK